MSELANVKLDDFEANARDDGATIALDLAGTADYAVIDSLDKLLTTVHAAAQQLAAREIVIDLRKLEFMNSSCFKSFVRWISEIQDLEPSRQYKVRFVSNPGHHWQKRSLRSLACFAMDLISVE